MKLDFADNFAGAVAGTFGSILVFLGAIWMAVTTGATALVAADWAGDGLLDETGADNLFATPQVLILGWILPGVLFLTAVYLRFSRIDGSGAIRWGILVGLISCAIVWSAADEIDSGWVPVAVAWTSLAILLAMIGTGLWFLRHWQMSRWAGEMAMLHSENAARRSELDQEAMPLQDEGPSR
jgi:hypothetical protein